ncbi:TetR/AcrR family transcriptional regulator [Nocardioides solisilvae]|uniref:TetR/AcrR family transcriptional regulator n=1 Tax=Nocardioides solisilvae TaxID=1542435 RepID=UPI00194ECC6F|nr:TetR/AcrR family transcriptional regulator [Nocardioides solisilvae]
MSTRESGRADGRRNRQSIVEAATRVLGDDPHASVTEIAEAAGLTRATVYRHFEDRDALTRAVVEETAALVVPAVLDEMRPLPWAGALDLLARRVVELSARYRDVVLAVVPHLEESARVAVQAEPIRAEIAARRVSGELTTPLSDDWLALCVRTLCLAAIRRLGDPATDPDELARMLARTLADVLG